MNINLLDMIKELYLIDTNIDEVINNFVECPICLKTKNEIGVNIAIVAPCLHVTCKYCLRSWFNIAGPKEFKLCPICKEIVDFHNDTRLVEKSEKNTKCKNTAYDNDNIINLSTLFSN